MDAHAALEVDQLSVSYGDHVVLWDVSFSLEPGKMVAVMGPNGAGKSTLLQAALALVKPFAGRALIFGKPAHVEKKRIAYLSQKKSVDWNFPATVLDVALMGRYHHLGALKWYRKRDKEAAFAALKELRLEELAGRQISELSGGQQQRLFLARALLQDPDLFFLDEPFAGIDKVTEQDIVTLLRQFRDKGKTVVVVHHDLNTVKRYFDQVVLLKTSLVACGDVTTHFTHENIKRAFNHTDGLFQEVRALAAREKAGVR